MFVIKKVIYFSLLLYLSIAGAANLEAGDPEFDYGLGRDLYEKQIYDQASFAFERVLIVEPNHSSAAQYLKLCYQKMGLAPKRITSKTQYGFSVSRGWDSNINEGTEIYTLSLPNLAAPNPLLPLVPLNIPIDETLRAIHDAFTRVRIKGDWIASLTDKHALFLAASAFYKKQDKYKNKRLDTADFFVKGGFSWKNYENELTIPFMFESFHTDARNLNNNPRTTISIGPSYTITPFKPHQWTLFGEGGATRYSQHSSHNIDFWLGGLRWSYAVSRLPIVWAIRGYGGLHHPEHMTILGKRYGNSFGGLGATVNWVFLPAHRLDLGFNGERRHYWTAFPLPQKRRDHLRVFNLGWQWDLTQHLSFHTDYSVRDNGSNIPFFAFDKRVLEFTVEYHLD